jgi:hypothetical protein
MLHPSLRLRDRNVADVLVTGVASPVVWQLKSAPPSAFVRLVPPVRSPSRKVPF